jgi:hypothetical protein
MPETIYGGPYEHESAAITEESQKKKPNYERLIRGWNTITQGALAYIDSLENPVEPKSGKFSENSRISKEEAENPPVPPVTLYVTPDEDIIDQDYKDHIDDPDKVVTVAEPKSETADSKKSDDLDLDKL